MCRRGLNSKRGDNISFKWTRAGPDCPLGQAWWVTRALRHVFAEEEEPLVATGTQKGGPGTLRQAHELSFPLRLTGA